MTSEENYHLAVTFLILSGQAILGAADNLRLFTETMAQVEYDFEPSEDEIERTQSAVDLLNEALGVLEEIEECLDRSLQQDEAATSTEQSPLLSQESDFIPN